MIFTFEVDGFKSLRDFSLEISPGLNILVGPNGSGKSNILSFLAFLEDLQNMPVSYAVSRSGGAGVILSKIGETTYKRTISCAVAGSVMVRSKSFFYYEYNFSLDLLSEVGKIIYRTQLIRVKSRSVGSRPKNRITDFDFECKQTVDDKLLPIIKVTRFRKEKIHSRLTSRSSGGIDKKTFEEQIGYYFNHYIGSENSLASILRFISNGEDIIEDLKGGKVFNIEPSKIRPPEDSATPPGIRSDGSGLYATLFAISNQSEPNNLYQYRLFDEPERLLAIDFLQILKNVILANDAIKSLTVINEPFDNKLVARVHIAAADVEHDTILPLSALSDGTLKWIDLITIIKTTPGIYSIEEPENYLHPLMQAEIVSIMREALGEDRFALISTHSETILNQADPDEIIIVSFENGKTVAGRPLNSKEVAKEIQRTGFGAGYYYIAGSFIRE